MVAFGQFLEVLLGGLLSGVLYSLVALGFVLIFKASGVFNFAQGAMVLLAGLALVRSLDFLVAKGFPVWTAILLGLAFAALIMAIAAWTIERFVLGPLVNQDALTLFMSTIGVTFVLEGVSQMVFGAEIYPLRLFPTDAWFLAEGVFPGGILVNQLDVWGGLIAGVLVAGLAVFFQRTKTGRALRAVANVLRGGIRPYDICVRYAGDEFIVVLSECSRELAETRRRELQERIAAIQLEVRPGKTISLGASIGAAVYPHDGANYEALLADADHRMYRDKTHRRRGRTRQPAAESHSEFPPVPATPAFDRETTVPLPTSIS